MCAELTFDIVLDSKLELHSSHITHLGALSNQGSLKMVVVDLAVLDRRGAANLFLLSTCSD